MSVIHSIAQAGTQTGPQISAQSGVQGGEPGIPGAAPAVLPFPHAVPEAAPAPPPRGRRRGLLIACALLAVGAGLAGWRLTRADSTPVAAPVPAPNRGPPDSFRLTGDELRALKVEPVLVRDFLSERVAEGRITYDEDRSTPVFAPYTGRVVRTIARLGEEVKAGDPLLEIETNDVVQAAGDLLGALDAAGKARVALDQARRDERRQSDLFGARAASARDVEQARAAASASAADQRTAEAALAAARDKLRVLGRTPEQVARVEQTRRVEAVVPVVAPLAGTVVQRRVGQGQWLAAGGTEPVYTIADLSTMWLVAGVRELDAPLMRVGQQVEVAVGALPDRRFVATIANVGAALDPQSRRLTVRAAVQDPERLLKPEMFATFRIAVGEGHRAGSVGVPMAAVILRGSEASVWQALDDDRFALRRITLGIRAGDAVEVTEGLAPGDRVVTAGALFVDRASRLD